MLGIGIGTRLRAFGQAAGIAVTRRVAPPAGTIAELALSHPDVLKFARELLTDIPQAVSYDETATLCKSRHARSEFSRKLTGLGLEIGALHRPIPQHPGMQVRYVDRHTPEELRAEYASLNRRFIRRFVAPDIIDDGARLETIADATYDFVVAAHIIEHLRNPIGALENWCRVLKPGGLIYLVVPDKRGTFDRRRVRTTLEHLILDYRQPSAERDFEHFLDYAVHVHRASGDAALAEADRLRMIDYSIHFHVFQPADLVEILRWFGTSVRPLDIVEGPVLDAERAEFHLLLKLASSEATRVPGAGGDNGGRA